VASTPRTVISRCYCASCEFVSTVNVKKNKFFVYGREVLINSTRLFRRVRAMARERKKRGGEGVLTGHPEVLIRKSRQAEMSGIVTIWDISLARTQPSS